MARPEELCSIIQQILSPAPEDAETLLEEIGLGTIPSREQVHHEIDAKLLSPPDTLPDHWLSKYQMYGFLALGFIELILFGADTGKLSLTFHPCFPSSLHHRLRV